MRIVLAMLTVLIGLSVTACTVHLGTVDPSHPDYNRPGVVVGELVIRQAEYHGPQYTIMTCTNEGVLRGQLDRVVPVKTFTRYTERQIRSGQIFHLTGWGCNKRVVRGQPSFERVGRYTSPSGQRFGIYRVWQRDGNIRRAFNLGFTAR